MGLFKKRSCGICGGRTGVSGNRRKITAFVMALSLMAVLCSCEKNIGNPPDTGTTEAAASSPDPAGTSESAAAEPTVSVALSSSSPIPVLSGDVKGDFIPYDEELHLNVFLPDGVEYKTEGGGFNNWKSVIFTPKDGSWKAKIVVGQNTSYPEWNNAEKYADKASANKILIENADYNGCSAKLFADEGENWKYDNGIYLMYIDLGSKRAGRHTTMVFEATGSEGMDKPADFLANIELAAIFNKLTIAESTFDGVYSQNGVTVTYPDSFVVKPHNEYGWNGSSVTNGTSVRVDVYTSRYGGQTPEEAAAAVDDDFTERTWGGRKWIVAVRKPADDGGAYSVTCFSDFSDSELLRCDVRISGASRDELLAYIEGDEFNSIINSVDASAEARQAANETEWDKNATDSSLFTLKGSFIQSYSGTDTDIIIPEHVQGMTVTGICDGAFKGSSLTSVQIPDTAVYIGQNAFSDSANLKSVRLPENIDYLGYGAFERTALTEVTLPCGVLEAGGAFGGCESLETVNWLCSLDIPSYAFTGCTSLKNFNTDSLVTEIGHNAFNNCTSLESIDLPSVTVIGDNAFFNCTSLKNTNFVSLEKIGQQAFNECGFEIIDEKLIGNAADIPYLAFGNCNNVREIRIPEGVKNIGESAFASAGGGRTPGLDIYIPAGVENIGKRAFEYCCIYNMYFSDGIKDISALPVWDGESKISLTVGNAVFGKDFYSANKDALADYCGKIMGIGADKASDTPSDTVIGDLEGEWEGTIEITGGSAKDGTFKSWAKFGYNQNVPYADIYQEGYDDSVISFWCGQKLNTGIATPNGWYNGNYFFEHELDDADYSNITLINRDNTITFDYDYNDGYTCHVRITLTKK